MIENVPLIHKLQFLFNSPIMNMADFKLDQAKKVLENAERKNQFKGLKCDTKPLSMDVQIMIKDLKLEKNYFDHSEEIILE